MVLENTFTFNHEARSINLAIGISEEISEKCRDIVLFSTVSNYFLSKELFDDESQVPPSLGTVSSVLEKSLKYVENEHEQMYIMLIFNNVHRMTAESIAKYEILNSQKNLNTDRINFILEMLDEKIEDAARKHDCEQFVSVKEVFKKIEAVKNSRYNFEKYLSLINE